MNNIIPFTKKLEFDTKFEEITSISLERSFNVFDSYIEGELSVNGDYKESEILNISKPFSFKIPFNIDLSDDINKETISLEINDFAYDIIDDKTIKVNIELILNYEKNVEEIIEEITPDENLLREDAYSDDIKDNIEQSAQEKNNEVIEVKEEIKETQDIVEDDYKILHIHVMKEEENIASICSIYNITEEELKEYNNIDNLKVGDKLLILKDEY